MAGRLHADADLTAVASVDQSVVTACRLAMVAGDRSMEAAGDLHRRRQEQRKDLEGQGRRHQPASCALERRHLRKGLRQNPPTCRKRARLSDFNKTVMS
jgi:hypothetical protein